MAKDLKIWIAKDLKRGLDWKRRSLKSICGAVGLGYSTGKKRFGELGKSGNDVRSIFMVGGEAIEIWSEVVKK